MHFLNKANEAEAKADRRSEQIRIREQRHLATQWKTQAEFWKDRNFEIEVDVCTAKAREKDPVWNSHASSQKWLMQKSMMHGAVATNELLERLLARS